MISNQAILSLLSSCCGRIHLTQLHAVMITTGLNSAAVPVSRLLDAAVAAAPDITYSHSIFSRHSLFYTPNLYMFNTMIRGFSTRDQPLLALQFYRDLIRSHISPDNFTFPFVFRACAQLFEILAGRSVHCRALKSGYLNADVYVSATLVHFYAICGEIDSAETAFIDAENRNVVTWTTMISAYAEFGSVGKAIELVTEMERFGIAPNEITMVHLISACARTRVLKPGKIIHGKLIMLMGDNRIRANVVLSTALLDMYAKCGCLDIAEYLFDKMPQRNIVSWNVIIGACSEYGQKNKVFCLLKMMIKEGVKPDKVTLLSLLDLSRKEGECIFGRVIHAYLEKTMDSCDTAIGTSLIDMYSQTGDAESALKVFAELQVKDVVTWTSTIKGLALHGQNEKALSLFREMEMTGIVPDKITFIGVMSACNHAGMVEDGRKYFDSMMNVYGITPDVEHYSCMVDLLSRAGLIAEADKLVKTMPVRPNVTIWGALLSGCEKYGEVDITEQIRKEVFELDPHGSGIYVLFSNVDAGAGRWEAVARARKSMELKGIRKTLGSSAVSAVCS